jgi:hypothetical protein
MERMASTGRKPGGLFVLLALLLSLLPATTQAAVAAAPSQRVALQLAESFAFEAAAAATIPQAADAARRDAEAFTGDGAASPVSADWTVPAPIVSRAGHVLPASGRPPSSTSTDAYRARAPPVE